MDDREKNTLYRDSASVTETEMQTFHDEFMQIDVPYESMKCKGFVRNIPKKKWDDLFRFVIDRSFESTNNRTERSVRPIVAYRKVSGGSRAVREKRLHHTENSYKFSIGEFEDILRKAGFSCVPVLQDSGRRYGLFTATV